MPDSLFLKELGFDQYAAGGNPGAGANLSYLPANGTRWQLWAISLLLTTSATVANRQMVLIASRGTTPFYVMQAQVVQAASLAVRYFFAPGYVDSLAIYDSRVLVRMPFPLEMWSNGSAANGGWILDSDVDNLQVGDAITEINVYYRGTIGAVT